MPFPDPHQVAAAKYARGRQEFSARRIAACLESMDRAEALGYDSGECAACRWDCWMLLGRFAGAWRESEGIAQRGGPGPYRFWDGGLFHNRRVIVRCLHGFGDAIQFLRFGRLLRGQAQSVIAETHPELVSLFRGMPFLDDVVTWAAGSSARSFWDQQIEVVELPRAFDTSLETIPGETPYLWVDGDTRERRARLLGPKHLPRVGLR